MFNRHTRWFLLALGLSACSVLTDVDRRQIVDPMFVRPQAGASGTPSAGAPAAGGGAGAAAGAGDDGQDAG